MVNPRVWVLNGLFSRCGGRPQLDAVPFEAGPTLGFLHIPAKGSIQAHGAKAASVSIRI